ncbi:iron-siderophore ABC transporter substrate-binding protein [Nostoc sp. UCD121]|uniref:iron-siderophore ABC transporter substrate-binding protein n=1 Tax=unclassified Nostoc TaxID=2593658 RepID=UPI00162A294E|nr:MULTISPECIES: iron-siderophore ABC transporter substrate-binding protein [unclassified Nostoc]MBC1222479.1 iron-siderophore ABC transporter substrate-binding protein [Nostoc sp. UCD120]MBC1277034.1 iron-siderophore ABC transporter substrate-binding protein [Nostoc sp. UCD121]MBC1297189.1 iron-siderophore ABC transporter substrate-binding protein [Nostoc sp. UCD122]
MNYSNIKIESFTRQWRLGIVIFITLLLAVACHHDGSISVNDHSTNTACHQVEHGAGITCIPEKFERLVTLDEASLENAIALGIKPVAAVISDFSSYLQDQLTGVKNIGTIGEPNLESILAIKPDLILGLDFQQSIYSLTSKIAPTVLFNFEHSGQWKEIFTNISLALGKKEVAQQVMAQYYHRLEEFKEQMGDNLSKIKISVVRIYTDNINIYLRDSFCGIVLQDAGLSRPESQNFTASEAANLFGNSIQVSIGNELIQKADGDVIFIWTGENTSQATQIALKRLEQLKANPLWQNLKAVQKNKVYLVPDYWIGSGILAANAIIDDLFKYVIDTP